MRHRDLTPRGPSAAQRRHLAAGLGTTVVVTPPPPPPPTPGLSVAVTVRKYTAGVATTVLGNGIPLVPGQLTPAQFDAGMGRLVISGAEVSAFYERLPGAFNLHPDGSLRSVYVQAQFANLDPAVPLAGEFRCNEARTASPLAFTDPAAAGWFDSPDAVNYVAAHAGPGIIWPTSATHLCNTGWFFTTRPRSENPVDGSKFAIAAARYDAKYDAGVGLSTGGAWDGTTAGVFGWDYYDRPYSFWAHAARTGDVTLMQSGTAQFLRRRAVYDVPNNYGYAPWVFPGHSLLIAYYLLRDTAARDSGLKTLASASIAPNPGNFLNYTNLGRATNDPRPQGNSLLAVLFAYLSGVTTTSQSTPLNVANIITTVQKALNADPAVYPGAPALPTSDLLWGTVDSDGNSPAFGPDPRLKQTNASSATVYTELAFQTSILFRPLMLLYDLLDWTGNQPTKDLILTRIRTTVDNWWTYLRVAEVGSSVGQYGTNFLFASAQYSTNGGGGRNAASADLNGFFEDVHYWLAKTVRATDPTAAATYVARGDELLDGGTRTAVVYTTTLKHWSENTHRRPHAFGYRQQATG